MNKIIILICLLLSGCASMTDRQKQVAWFVAGVAVVSIANQSDSVATPKKTLICEHNLCEPVK